MTAMPAKEGIQGGKETGFRVKPGMTSNVKGWVTRHTGPVWFHSTILHGPLKKNRDLTGSSHAGT
jgi:hypothetical protein